MQIMGSLEIRTNRPLCFAATLLVATVLTACAVGRAADGEGQKPEGQLNFTPDSCHASPRSISKAGHRPNLPGRVGFDDPSEAASATLGEPIRVSMVRLDALRKYSAGGDPERLLTDVGRVIYPVFVGDR